MDKYQAQKAKEYLINKSYSLDLRSECCSIIECPNFFIWSGSANDNHHHYGDYGLIIHTQEVIRNCSVIRKLNKKYLDIDEKELFLAGLYHDVGKIFDYEKKDEIWKPSKHKRLIHHISRSVIIWNEHANKHEKLKKYKDRVTHDILAHHGMKEWGSPVTPATKAAWLLHLCDNISARLDDCNKQDI